MVIAIINPYSLIVILFEVLLVAILIRKTVGIMRAIWNLDLEARGFILSHLSNVVSDLVSVRSLNIEKYMFKEMEESSNLTTRMSIHYCAIMSLF